MSPSFQKLSDKYKQLILNGLKAEFNIGQFIQTESPAASLGGLAKIGGEKDSLDFYLLHAICDIAGAAGHLVQNGSTIMTEATYQGFNQAVSSLERLSEGWSITEVYNHYLTKKSLALGLSLENLPTDERIAITKICCLLRHSNSEQAQEVQKLFEELSADIQQTLKDELNKKGVEDGLAILVYYSPALLANLKEDLKTGLEILAKIYQISRKSLKGREDENSGVYTVMISEVAKLAKKEPEVLKQAIFTLNPVGKDAEIKPS